MTGQTQFHGALLDAAHPIPQGLVDGQGRPAGRRYAVYRNNVAVSLTEALETGFPAVAKLIGTENFSKAAGIYLRQSPPSSPILALYGKGFPEFLEGLDPLKGIGYLADVARLEYALRESYHAADAQPLDPARLQELDDAQLNAMKFTLAPSLRLLRSPWPVVSIYRFTMDPANPKPEAQAEDVLITRPEFDPEPHILPQGGADFLLSLAKGARFDTAQRAAGHGFDLITTLSLLLSTGAITDIHEDTP